MITYDARAYLLGGAFIQNDDVVYDGVILYCFAIFCTKYNALTYTLSVWQNHGIYIIFLISAYIYSQLFLFQMLQLCSALTSRV